MKTINLYLRRLKMDGIVKDMIKNCVLVTVTFYGALLIINLINVAGNLVF